MRAALLALLIAVPALAEARPRWQTLPAVPALPAPVSEGDLAIDDVTLHYATYGEGDPVVLLHGGLGSGEQFGAQVPALAASYQVIVVDSRGHGRSTRPTRTGMGYRQMATDVVALLDHLRLPRASVVGWSDGGVTALELAIHHPARVERVVVIGATFDRTGLMKARSATFTGYYARCVKTYRQVAPAPGELGPLRTQLRAMWAREPRYDEDQLRAIAAPLLIVQGDHDELVRRSHVERMAALVPGASLHVLPDTSHFAMWQDPDGFNQAVLAFLAGRAP